VLSLILDIGREFGMRAMRLPLEIGAPYALRPWMALMRARLARAGIAYNDHVFGLAQSGAMDTTALLDALSRLPSGITEIYCHPAMSGDSPITPSMRAYRHADELNALLSPLVASAIAAAGLALGGFADHFPLPR
jgi:chitin disaccharide deacetylase